MLRRRRVHVVFIAMSVCQQLAAAIERKDSIVNDSLTSSLTLFGYTSVKPVQLEAIHDLLEEVRRRSVLLQWWHTLLVQRSSSNRLLTTSPKCVRCPRRSSDKRYALLGSTNSSLHIPHAITLWQQQTQRVQAVLWLVQNPRAPPATWGKWSWTLLLNIKETRFRASFARPSFRLAVTPPINY